jgi:hypothetical protein
MRSGKSSATLTVLAPMEPVLPRRTTFFIYDLRYTIDMSRVLSLTPGFSRVWRAQKIIQPLQRFPTHRKTVETVLLSAFVRHPTEVGC